MAECHPLDSDFEDVRPTRQGCEDASKCEDSWSIFDSASPAVRRLLRLIEE